MSQLNALRSFAEKPKYQKGDVLVVFGELFSRGYANGIIDEAKKIGMDIIYATVGRREKDGSLRNLTDEELKEKSQPIINVALEAGFDMEPSSQGMTPCQQLKDVKIGNWQEAQLDWNQIEDSRQKGRQRFDSQVKKYMEELQKLLPQGKNILFVHTMAGGVPRAKILMPAMNRVFKGMGERFVSSKNFWEETDIGKLCKMNFEEVTARTFGTLVEASTEIRKKAESQGGQVSYVAYGYHGTEVLVGDKYEWQTYCPYVQGWAKIKLEELSQEFYDKGIQCCVFNCPEILTNSSSVFQGVEVSLYTLIAALRKEGGSAESVRTVLNECKNKLKDEHNLEEVEKLLQEYLNSDQIKNSYEFKTWPQHNNKEQMEYMLTTSKRLYDMHKSNKDLLTFPLSEVVVQSTGALMIAEAWSPSNAVSWIGHDVIAKYWAHKN